MRVARVALLLLAACGDDADVAVTLHTGSAIVVAVDTGDGWERLPPNAAATIEVEGPYAWMSACGAPGAYVDVITELRTPDDGRDVILPCQFVDEVVPISVDVTDAPAWVFAGDGVVFVDGRATLFARAGTTDVLALSAADRRFVIERDATLAPSATLSVDLAEGDLLGAHEVVLDNVTDEDRAAGWSGDTLVRLAGASTVLPGDGDRLTVIPSDYLRGDDVHEAHIHLSREGRSRWVTGPVGAPPFVAALPDPITDATVEYDGTVRASWTDPRDWDRATLGVVARDGTNTRWSVVATRRWLDGARALEAPDARDAPGFDPTWLPAPADAVVTLGLSNDREGVGYTAGD